MFNESFNCDMLKPSVVIFKNLPCMNYNGFIYELELTLHGIHKIWTIDGSTLSQVNGS